MAFRFDLTGIGVSPTRAAAPPVALVASAVSYGAGVVGGAGGPCRPCDPEDGASPQLTFSLGPTLPAPRTGLVRRFAAPVLQRFGVDVGECKRAERGDDDEHDQYTVRPGRSMCWAVLFRNDTGRDHPKSLLGRYGHLERLSSWIHLVGGVAFGVYAILRPSVITSEHNVAETLTTVAAAAVCFCFLSSTVYHVTSPSRRLSYLTRQLDFFGIYFGIAVGGLSDYAIATRGFQNTALLSILDGPLAAVLVTCFFFARRGLLPSADTWNTYLGGCTVNFGLMRRSHIDLEHTGVRQATSFVLAISYFLTVPSLYSNFGSNNATVIVAIELAAVVIIVLGMSVDNYFVFPDSALAAGKGPRWLVCKPCGCVGSSHAIWHALSVVAAVKAAASREFALSLER